MLYAVCCVLYAVCYMMYAICCMLYAVCCVLYAVCGMRYDVCCMMYAVCCMMYDVTPEGAIVFTGYPGQAGGTGLISTLFGNYNPSGRLTQTFYRQEYMTEVSFFDMHFRPGEENPGRGYRFYSGKNVVYPFGSGLSYTTFEYFWEVDKIVAYGLNDHFEVHVSVLVTNVGKVKGSETVLIYVIPPPNSMPGQPIRQLCQFSKVQLASQQQERMSFTLSEQDFSLAKGQMEVVHGSWMLQIGDSEQVVVV